MGIHLPVFAWRDPVDAIRKEGDAVDVVLMAVVSSQTATWFM